MDGEGQLTSIVYSLIRDQEWDEAIEILNHQLVTHSGSRAALSLLAFCHCGKEDYETAVRLYEELNTLYPCERLKASLFQEALTLKAEDTETLLIRAHAKYELDDLVGSQALITQICRKPTDDPAVFTLRANLNMRQSKYEEALKDLQSALELQTEPRILYAIALAHYRLKHFPACLKALGELVDAAARMYPDLAGGAQVQVSNGQALLGSALVEAFNLKAAVEWTLGDTTAASRALESMPRRSEDQLDPVTLHNRGLNEMHAEPSEGIKKLQFLIKQPPFPPEAFSNLLTIYIQHGLYELAADLLADNPLLAASSLEQEILQFFSAVVTSRTSPEEAYSKLEGLRARHAAALRRLRHDITSARKGSSRDEEAENSLLQQYESRLALFVPAVCWQAGILYDLGRVRSATEVLSRHEDLMEEHPAYNLNMGHAAFELADHEGCTKCYQNVVEHAEDILSVPAIALANLCVAIILSHRNKEAELLMGRIDQAEQEFVALHGASRPHPMHLCVVNLVIGTLYCAKGNMPFGVGCVLKGLKPISSRLSPDVWLYAKRPILALAESCAMSFGGPPDEDLVGRVVEFLEEVIAAGKEMPVVAASIGAGDGPSRTVAQEARDLKCMYLAFAIN